MFAFQMYKKIMKENNVITILDKKLFVTNLQYLKK